MKKIAVFNLNVGSAVEYAGKIFISWLEELEDVEVRVYTLQTVITDTVKFLYEYQPDLIVINEDHHRIVVSNMAYRGLRYAPIIYVDHSWYRINDADNPRQTEAEETWWMWYKHMLDYSNHIFCINYKPDTVEWNPRVKGKISNRYYPTNPELFKVTTPWADRQKMFCAVGNLLRHKFAMGFMAAMRGTDLHVDCYGRNDLDMGDWKYKDAIEFAQEKGNITLKGEIPQHAVTDVLNQYKYLVLPHDGFEPFNWVLKQAMHCGTVPLVANRRDTNQYYGKWIDWADGLYLGVQFFDELVENMEHIVKEDIDMSDRSVYMSQEVQRRFPYQEFKDEFKMKAQELLNG